jgi:hypothetical protein
VTACGDLAPERGIRLFADAGSACDIFDVGEALTVRISGVRHATVHDVVLCDADGSAFFISCS